VIAVCALQACAALALAAATQARAEPSVAAPADTAPAPDPAPDRATRPYIVAPLAEFPREAIREGINGRCDVLFRIDEQGVPRDIRPTCNSPLFEAAAVRAFMRARLNMATEGLKPDLWVSQPLIFQLEPAPPPPEG
jgi:TonB family protein